MEMTVLNLSLLTTLNLGGLLIVLIQVGRSMLSTCFLAHLTLLGYLVTRDEIYLISSLSPKA